MADRIVHVRKGQTVRIDAGGPLLEVTRYASGAVELRRVGLDGSRPMLRSWSPKETSEERRSRSRVARVEHA